MDGGSGSLGNQLKNMEIHFISLKHQGESLVYSLIRDVTSVQKVPDVNVFCESGNEGVLRNQNVCGS